MVLKTAFILSNHTLSYTMCYYMSSPYFSLFFFFVPYYVILCQYVVFVASLKCAISTNVLYRQLFVLFITENIILEEITSKKWRMKKMIAARLYIYFSNGEIFNKILITYMSIFQSCHL